MSFVDSVSSRVFRRDIRFKKVALIGFALTMLVFIALLVRIMTGMAGMNETFNESTFFISIISIAAAIWAAILVIWLLGRQKGWKFTDVAITVGMYGSGVMFALFHVMVLTPL